MKYATLHRFYNENDIHNFGCGWRTVLALPAGRKWITLVDWTTLDLAKVQLSEWARLKPQQVEYRAGRVLAAIKLRQAYYEEKPLAIKEVIKQLKVSG